MSATLYDALERAVKMIKEQPNLAPVSMVAITDDGVLVTPWVFGTPLTALLTWHDAMTEVERELEVADSYSKVVVRGLLGDVPMIVQATTHVELTGNRSRISAAALRTAARDEEPFDEVAVDEEPSDEEAFDEAPAV